MAQGHIVSLVATGLMDRYFGFNKTASTTDLVLPDESSTSVEATWTLPYFNDLIDTMVLQFPSEWGDWPQKPDYPTCCIDQICLVVDHEIHEYTFQKIGDQELKIVCPSFNSVKLRMSDPRISVKFCVTFSKKQTLENYINNFIPIEILSQDVEHLICNYGATGIYRSPIPTLCIKSTICENTEHHRLNTSPYLLPPQVPTYPEYKDDYPYMEAQISGKRKDFKNTVEYQIPTQKNPCMQVWLQGNISDVKDIVVTMHNNVYTISRPILQYLDEVYGLSRESSHGSMFLIPIICPLWGYCDMNVTFLYQFSSIPICTFKSLREFPTSILNPISKPYTQIQNWEFEVGNPCYKILGKHCTFQLVFLLFDTQTLQPLRRSEVKENLINKIGFYVQNITYFSENLSPDFFIKTQSLLHDCNVPEDMYAFTFTFHKPPPFAPYPHTYYEQDHKESLGGVNQTLNLSRIDEQEVRVVWDSSVKKYPNVRVKMFTIGTNFKNYDCPKTMGDRFV